MRALIVLLAGAAGMAAQAAPQVDVAAKLRQFEQNLENALRPKGTTVFLKGKPAPSPVCSIPLLQVSPDSSLQSKMPLIVPDVKKTFAARDLVPPAPVCQGK